MIDKTDEKWRQILTPEQFAVLRKKNTEAPFSGEYDGLYADGVYACAACGQVFLTVRQSLTPIVDGRVFTMPSLAAWSFIATLRWEWSGRR